MIVPLLLLGFGLSLDNFRTSIALGTQALSWQRSVQVALMFGFWDGLAPLAGAELGRYFGHALGPIADYVGPVVLGVYGLCLLIRVFWTTEPERIDHPWALFGIPLSLSLDNLLAGASLGLFGLSPVIAAVVFAAVTTVMSFVGLNLGRVAAHVIRIRSDLLSGIALLIAAGVLAVES